MIRRSDLTLTPLEDEILRTATRPGDYIGIGLNPADYLEDTDWILTPDGDPYEPGDWLNVNRCDTCPHGMPIAEDTCGIPMHYTEEYRWKPCDPEEYGLALIGSYSRFDTLHDRHVLDSDNLLAPYHGVGKPLPIGTDVYRSFTLVTPAGHRSDRFMLLTEADDGRLEGELHEMRPDHPVKADAQTVAAYYGINPLARFTADYPWSDDDYATLAGRLERLLA